MEELPRTLTISELSDILSRHDVIWSEPQYVDMEIAKILLALQSEEHLQSIYIYEQLIKAVRERRILVPYFHASDETDSLQSELHDMGIGITSMIPAYAITTSDGNELFKVWMKPSLRQENFALHLIEKLKDISVGTAVIGETALQKLDGL